MKKKRKKQLQDDKRLTLRVAKIMLVTAIISMMTAIISLIAAVR